MRKLVLVIALVWSGTAAAQMEGPPQQEPPPPPPQETPQQQLQRRIELLRAERIRQQQLQQQQQQQQEQQPQAPPKPPRPPEPPIQMPTGFRMPTGHLLPAGVLFTSSGIDTGAGFSSQGSVGLGDVAEFGIEVNDFVRAQSPGERDPHRIYPYALALFKVGVGEGRLWSWQPAMSIGFRKSFEKDDNDYTTREAELFFVMSKTVLKHVGLHAGGTFWDASLQNHAAGTTLTLHDQGVGKQMEAFGGIDAEPFDGSQIMVELIWTPQFTYADPNNENIKDAIELKPILSWGVRYRVADWIFLESGVRVPDIGNADLLHAQIFGQIKFVSRALAHVIHGE